MKYAIYGQGVVGKRLFNFLGKDRISCFIDGNVNKVGMKYKDVPICSLSEYKEKYCDDLIIVTPVMVIDEITQILEKQNIQTYLTLFGSLDSFYDYPLEEYLSIIKNESGEIRLFGEDVLTAIIAAECNDNVIVFQSKEKAWNDKILKFLHKRNEKIEFCNNIDNNVQSLKEMFQNASVSRKTKKDFHLEDIKEAFEGKEECFIVATGPSLKMEDLEKLKKYKIPCISMNGIIKAFDKTSWRPNIYITSDSRYIEGEKETLDKLDLQYKFCSDTTDCLKNDWRRFHLIIPHEKVFFSEDIEKGLCSSMNVTFLAMQLAAVLGFKKVYLIGVDFTFGDTNCGHEHFVNDYTAVKEKSMYNLNTNVKGWHLAGYKAADNYSKDHDVKFYNATRGGELEVFKRIDLDKYFYSLES